MAAADQSHGLAGEFTAQEAGVVAGFAAISLHVATQIITGVAQRYENKAQGPLRDRVGRAIGGIDNADISLPGRLHIDALGETIAVQFADEA